MWAFLCFLPPGPSNVRGNPYFVTLSQIGFSFSLLLFSIMHNGKITQSEGQNTDEQPNYFVLRYLLYGFLCNDLFCRLHRHWNEMLSPLASSEEKVSSMVFQSQVLGCRQSECLPSSSPQAVWNSPAGAWVPVLMWPSETSCHLNFYHFCLILCQPLGALVTFGVIPNTRMRQGGFLLRNVDFVLIFCLVSSYTFFKFQLKISLLREHLPDVVGKKQVWSHRELDFKSMLSYYVTSLRSLNLSEPQSISRQIQEDHSHLSVGMIR